MQTESSTTRSAKSMFANDIAERPSAEVVKKLVDDLENAATNTKGKALKRVYELSDSAATVVSWKFNEWDYGKSNIQLPCNARGLFISDGLEPEIVARGYDKFFNINEVPTTRWDWIEKNTVSPYEVTLKSNGCIIFISGLKDGTLVVCSKHSTGPREDIDRNHAEKGRKYVQEQLIAKGYDVKSFAQLLYELNVTAVAEYCDDSFEEHILEYKGEKAGLYLHGVNLNTRKFKTWPMDHVTKFACKYGFKTTDYFLKDDVTSLRSVLEQYAKYGSYDGTEVEGFVIRCKLKENGDDFFFKYKFEEPYLMYRQWREVTKDYLTTRCRVFKFRKHKFITNKYLDFAIPLLERDPEVCEAYLRGFGIIKLRNMFLQSYGMSGIEVLNYSKICELEIQNSIDFDKVDEHTKFLIFPIAVIGCGKTTTSLTLKNLYKSSWDVVQNDDITSKDKSLLMKKSLQLLADPKIKCVVVDRNNHQYRERQQLFDWLFEFKEEYLPYDTNIKVIGLSFLSPENIDEVKSLTQSRVLARGDNHQSIKSSTYGEKKVLGIMNGFINRFQPVQENRSPDNMFDLIVNLQVAEVNSSFSNALHIIKKLHEVYPVLVPSLPSDEEVQLAFEKSLSYKPTIVKVVRDRSETSKKRSFKPSFISGNVKDKAGVVSEIADVLTHSQIDLHAKSDIDRLFDEDKFQKEFHITLAHVSQGRNGSASEKAIWSEYMKDFQGIINGSDKVKVIDTNHFFRFTLKKLCWDEKIVSVIVELTDESMYDGNGKILSKVSYCNKVPHITVGILNEKTRPYYSNELCQKIINKDTTNKGHSIDFSSKKKFEAEVRLNL